MDPEQREIIRSNLREIDLLLRAIWRKGKAQIEQGSELQSLVKGIEGHKEPIYALLDREEKLP